MQVYTIYKATNILNNKSYIGFDSKWPARKKRHLSTHRAGCTKFHNAIFKYGIENFKWEILFQGWDKDFIFYACEPYFIEEFQTTENGYNISSGGNNAKHIQNIIANRGGHWLKGKKRNGNYHLTTQHNKGLVCYYDSILYKEIRIKVEDVDEFLKENPTYKKGFSPKRKSNSDKITGIEVPSTQKPIITPFGVFHKIESACQKLKMHRKTINKKLKSDKYPEWQYLPKTCQ